MMKQGSIILTSLCYKKHLYANDMPIQMTQISHHPQVDEKSKTE